MRRARAWPECLLARLCLMRSGLCCDNILKYPQSWYKSMSTEGKSHSSHLSAFRLSNESLTMYTTRTNQRKDLAPQYFRF